MPSRRRANTVCEKTSEHTGEEVRRYCTRFYAIRVVLPRDMFHGHDDSIPPPEIKVKARHSRHRGRSGKVTPDEWASEKGSDSEGEADVLNQIHRRLRDLSPNPVRPPRPEAPPFEA